MNSPIPLMTAQVRYFMEVFEQPTYPSCEKTPPEIASFRASLIEEESKEFHHAPAVSTEELDAICDLLYVVIGTAVTCSVALDATIPQASSLYVQKIPLYDRIIPCIQDLYCKFPCHKSQVKYLNAIIEGCLDVASCVGYDLVPAFTAVHLNNMDKLWPSIETLPPGHTSSWKGTGFLVKNAKGKVLKPPSHVPPDLALFMPKSS